MLTFLNRCLDTSGLTLIELDLRLSRFMCFVSLFPHLAPELTRLRHNARSLWEGLEHSIYPRGVDPMIGSPILQEYLKGVVWGILDREPLSEESLYRVLRFHGLGSLPFVHQRELVERSLETELLREVVMISVAIMTPPRAWDGAVPSKFYHLFCSDPIDYNSPPRDFTGDPTTEVSYGGIRMCRLWAEILSGVDEVVTLCALETIRRLKLPLLPMLIETLNLVVLTDSGREEALVTALNDGLRPLRRAGMWPSDV